LAEIRRFCKSYPRQIVLDEKERARGVTSNESDAARALFFSTPLPPSRAPQGQQAAWGDDVRRLRAALRGHRERLGRLFDAKGFRRRGRGFQPFQISQERGKTIFVHVSDQTLIEDREDNLPDGLVMPGGFDNEGTDDDLLPIAELSGLLRGAGFERSQSGLGLFSALAGRFDFGGELIGHLIRFVQQHRLMLAAISFAWSCRNGRRKVVVLFDAQHPNVAHAWLKPAEVPS
jgi:hypothetical protein